MSPNPYDNSPAGNRQHPARRPPTLARRVLPVIALGGAAGALVMALDHPGGAGSGSASALDQVSSETAVPAGAVTVLGPSGAGAVESTVPAVPQRSTAGASGSTTSTSAPTSVAATAAPVSTSECRTYKGPTQYNRFGAVQVQASVSSSGKICSVKVIELPTDNRSVRINNRAVPVLNSQAMAAQSASIDGVSGATYTTVGYIDSLQAIIDAATH